MTDVATLNIAIARALWGFHTPAWDAATWPWWYSDEDGLSEPRLPSFSTDIEAAMKVVDKLMETMFAVALRANHESGWTCEFERSNGQTVASTAATVAEAICNAALRACKTAPL